MAEARQYIFDYKEVVEALLKKQGIHEGIWALYIEFGFAAANLESTIDGGSVPQNTPKNINPTAIVPIRNIGIIIANEINSISVDAAEVNPRLNPTSKTSKK